MYELGGRIKEVDFIVPIKTAVQFSALCCDRDLIDGIDGNSFILCGVWNDKKIIS